MQCVICIKVGHNNNKNISIINIPIDPYDNEPQNKLSVLYSILLHRYNNIPHESRGK